MFLGCPVVLYICPFVLPVRYCYYISWSVTLISNLFWFNTQVLICLLLFKNDIRPHRFLEVYIGTYKSANNTRYYLHLQHQNIDTRARNSIVSFFLLCLKRPSPFFLYIPKKKPLSMIKYELSTSCQQTGKKLAHPRMPLRASANKFLSLMRYNRFMGVNEMHVKHITVTVSVRVSVTISVSLVWLVSITLIYTQRCAVVQQIYYIDNSSGRSAISH